MWKRNRDEIRIYARKTVVLAVYRNVVLMRIFHRKSVEIPTIERGAIVTIYLDDSAIRMALKYQVNPKEFMVNALLDELHNKAILRENITFQ